MNMTISHIILGVACVTVIQFITVDCYECCQHQQLFLKMENDQHPGSPEELIIGKDFTLTCFANKTVTNDNCDPGINCAEECEPARHGVAMWFCRDDMSDISECLESQIHSGPQHCLQFNSTTEDLGELDTAVNITASYTIKNGLYGDSDRYYCVASTHDDCFYPDGEMLVREYIDVEFKEPKAPHGVNISSSENTTSPTIYVKKGDSLNLTCDASGYPTPNISWYHNDTLKKTWKGQVKAFFGITQADKGKYMCMATNIQGSKNSTVLKIKVKTDLPWWIELWWIWVIVGVVIAALIVLICYLCHKRCCSQCNTSININVTGNNNRCYLCNLFICCDCYNCNNPRSNSYTSLDEGQQNNNTQGSSTDVADPPDIESTGNSAQLERESNTAPPYGESNSAGKPDSENTPDSTDGGSNSAQPVVSDHTNAEHWMVYFHESDSEYAQRAKDYLETRGKCVTLWQDPKINGRNTARSVRYLSKAIKNSNYTVIIRTVNFVNTKEDYFVQAVHNMPNDIQNNIKTKMYILSKVSCSLPECIQSGPTLIRISDGDESGWERFHEKVASLSNSSITPNGAYGPGLSV